MRFFPSLSINHNAFHYIRQLLLLLVILIHYSWRSLLLISAWFSTLLMAILSRLWILLGILLCLIAFSKAEDGVLLGIWYFSLTLLTVWHFPRIFILGVQIFIEWLLITILLSTLVTIKWLLFEMMSSKRRRLILLFRSNFATLFFAFKWRIEFLLLFFILKFWLQLN